MKDDIAVPNLGQIAKDDPAALAHTLRNLELYLNSQRQKGPAVISNLTVDQIEMSGTFTITGLGNGLMTHTGSGAYTVRTITAPAAGITVSNGSGVSGNPTLALANDLAAVEGLASAGLAARTGADAWAVRTLTAPAAGITVTNGDGAAGNPTLALANDLAALEGLGSTGIAVRSAANTWVQRSVAGTANEITVTNGDGVSGNPTASLPAALTFTGKTITGGTYASAAFNGTLGATTPSSAAVTTLAMSSNLTYSGNELRIFADTSDASDTKALWVGGGGAASPSRGGYGLFYGNEHASLPGQVYLVAGTSPGGAINLVGPVNLSTNPITGVTDLTMSGALATGTLSITGGAVVSGEWTPTLTGITNVASSTAFLCQYIRVGARVMCWGGIAAAPTTTALSTQLDFSLPIASNIGGNEDARGTATCQSPNVAGNIAGEAANNRASLFFVAGSAGNHAFTFSFGYKII